MRGSDSDMDGDAVGLDYEGAHRDYKLLTSTAGNIGFDISRMRADLGLVTYDPGFANTASTHSSITYINGAEGTLTHRGYSIEELAENCTFLEVSYLLLFGKLPTRLELDGWTLSVKHHTLLSEEMKRFFDAFPRSAHPMAILSSATNAISTFYEEYHDPKNADAVNASALRLVAKMPTIAAFAYKKSAGQPYMYPRNDLTYVENFLHMMFALPVANFKIDPVITRALNVLLILHADHGQNCSTATVRFVGSSQANLFASVAAGINALWGPLHGGANQAVVEMLKRIHNDPTETPQSAIARAKGPRGPISVDGLWPPGLQELRPQGQDPQQVRRGCVEESRHGRPSYRNRPRARTGGADGRLLHRAKSLPERGLLFGNHLPGVGISGTDVYGAFCHRSTPRVDRKLERDDRGPLERGSADRARSTPATPSCHSCPSPTASRRPRRGWIRRRSRSQLQ